MQQSEIEMSHLPVISLYGYVQQSEIEMQQSETKMRGKARL